MIKNVFFFFPHPAPALVKKLHIYAVYAVILTHILRITRVIAFQENSQCSISNTSCHSLRKRPPLIFFTVPRMPADIKAVHDAACLSPLTLSFQRLLSAWIPWRLAGKDWVIHQSRLGKQTCLTALFSTLVFWSAVQPWCWDWGRADRFDQRGLIGRQAWLLKNCVVGVKGYKASVLIVDNLLHFPTYTLMQALLRILTLEIDQVRGQIQYFVIGKRTYLKMQKDMRLSRYTFSYSLTTWSLSLAVYFTNYLPFHHS